MTNTTDPPATVNENPSTLRLVWPQWQGAGVESVRQLFSEVPFEEARRGYAVGAAVLNAVLPAHTGPTALVAVESGDRGLSKQDGIEAKEAVIAQLAAALEVIGHHSPMRILTLGGECSVSVAPFSWLAQRYGDDLAVLWIDSHPDVGTPASHYSGYHAMAVAPLPAHLKSLHSSNLTNSVLLFITEQPGKQRCFLQSPRKEEQNHGKSNSPASLEARARPDGLRTLPAHRGTTLFTETRKRTGPP